FCISSVFVFVSPSSFCLFFFNDSATPEIYTLSLHDALPISDQQVRIFGVGLSEADELVKGVIDVRWPVVQRRPVLAAQRRNPHLDRKSTRLNSSHVKISYAVFCLKKKKKHKKKKRQIVNKQQ